MVSQVGSLPFPKDTMLILICIALTWHTAVGLTPPAMPATRRYATLAAATRHPPLRLQEYTETQKLRAEVESPFAQVRLFAFPALFAAASIATYFAGTALLASAVGAREPSPNGLGDLAIDLGSMGALGFLWRRELGVREARLKRIAFGSKLAALRVFRLAFDSEGSMRAGQGVTLADLRRGRGQARRVVVICAPEAALTAALQGACEAASELSASDVIAMQLFQPLPSDHATTVAQA